MAAGTKVRGHPGEAAPLRAVMCSVPMGEGRIVRTDEAGLVWVEIGGTEYPFYRHEVTVLMKCVRVYYNRDRVVLDLPEAEVGPWLEYNQTMRFGCALFVDGECRYPGYFSEADAAGIAADLRANPPAATPPPVEFPAFGLRRRFRRVGG